MGRPRDPRRAQRQTGHRRKPDEAPLARVVSIAPELPPGPPPPPDDLDEAAHEMWHTAVAELAHRGLKPADLEAIRMMCMAALRARQAAKHIAEYGLVVTTENGGVMTNPMIRVEKDATFTYLRIAEQFALTFASRLRLGVVQLQGQTMAASLSATLDAPIAVKPRAKKSTKKSAKKAK